MKKESILWLSLAGIVIVTFVSFVNKPFSAKPLNIQETSNDSNQTSDSAKMGGYLGKLLAGTTSPYLAFNKSDYEKALKENKVILLDFYANWCPICRGEEPVLKEAFNKFNSDKVVGFRVNYKDIDTDKSEEELARQFNIPYQHTKVVLKDGKEVLRSSEVWDQSTFVEKLTPFIN